jgi:hypothetical protein
MRYHRHLTRILSGLLILMIPFEAPIAGISPSAQVDHAQVLVDSKGNMKEVEIAFLVQAEFVVGYVTLFYRSAPAEEFKRIELKRDPKLLYATRLPMAPIIEYYLELTPERGENVIIGSPTTPSLLETSQLPKVAAAENEEDGWFRKVLGVLTSVVLVAIVALLGGAGGRGSKK